MKETRGTMTTKSGWTTFFFGGNTERCFVYIQRVRFLQLKRICQGTHVLPHLFCHVFMFGKGLLSREPGCYKVFPHLFCHVFMFGKGLSSIVYRQNLSREPGSYMVFFPPLKVEIFVLPLDHDGGGSHTFLTSPSLSANLCWIQRVVKG